MARSRSQIPPTIGATSITTSGVQATGQRTLRLVKSSLGMMAEATRRVFSSGKHTRCARNEASFLALYDIRNKQQKGITMSRRQRKKEKMMLIDTIVGINHKVGDISAKLNDIKGMSDEATSSRRRQIDGLKAVSKTAWGISMFAHKNLSAISGDKASAESLCRRLDYLMKSICELLNANGVSIIAPQKYDEVSPINHRIVGQDELGEGDAPGTVSDCWEIGFIQHGVVSPAEVTVFKQVNN